MASLYRVALETWLKNISIKADSCVDIGGSTYPISSKGRLKSFECNNYVILDNGNEESFHDKWREPDMVLDIDNPVDWAIEEVDCVFMLEVAEYLKFPQTAVDNIHNLLKDGGIAYTSWPTIYPLHQPIQSDRYRYSKQVITELFSKFSHIDITPRVATKGRQALSEFYSLEGMRMAKVPEVFDLGYMVRSVK